MSNTPIMGNFWEGDNRVDTASHGVQLLAHIQNFLYTYVSSYGYPLLRGCGTGVAGCRAHGVVVSHPLRMRKALGSIPSVSIWYAALQELLALQAPQGLL